MTDIELLPLPEADDSVENHAQWPIVTVSDVWLQKSVQDYARACVAHATAAKDAEIEALRAEVERLTFEMGCLQQQYDERTSYVIVHRGAALACSESAHAAYTDEHHRAERMAEALRFYADTNNWVGRFVTDPTTPAEEDGGDNARESLRDHDQETGNG